jgi:hypothetical protein
MQDSQAHERAEAAFAKKQKMQTEAREAWAEHDARNAAIAANTKRLKALRLAREASQNGSAVSKKPSDANRLER